MKIGIIGTGRVGSTLATRWAAQGHAIMLGSRDPGSDHTRVVLAETPGANAGTIEDTAAWADVLLLAVPSSAAQAALTAAGDLRGKIIMDAANWFGEKPAGVTASLSEAVAHWAPGAKVVKAFNMTGFGNMADPNYNDLKADLFICGDDPDAKAVVAELASSIGFDVVDAGLLNAAGLLESLAQLWVHLAYAQGMGPNIAWKLLRR
jgi:predicted dinucleotide-binding enzyme